MTARWYDGSMSARTAIVILAVAGGAAHAAPCAPRDATTTKQRLTADALEVCYDTTCLRLPYAKPTWVAGADLPDPPAPPDAPPTFVATQTTIVRVCAPASPTTCKDVELPDTSALGPLAVDATRTHAVATGPLPKQRSGRAIHVLDLASGGELATIAPWDTPMGKPAFFQSVRFVDETVLATISYSPVSSQSRLYDVRGKLLAQIGGREGELDESAVPLGAHRWAFGTFGADKVFVLDVATGKTLATIATARRDAPPQGGFPLLATTPDGATLVALRADAGSGATFIDLKTRKATRHPVPTCK